MGVKLRTRGKSQKKIYFLDINRNGMRWTETLKIPKEIEEVERRRLASILRADREKQLFYSQHGMIKPISRNFIAYFDEFSQNYSKASYKKMRNAYKVAKKYFGATLLTTQMTRSVLLKYRQFLIDNFNGETPATIFGQFRRAVNEALTEGLFTVNPLLGVRTPPKTRLKVKEVLNEHEIRSLIKTSIQSEVEKAFLWCCFTGMTYPEVKKLKYSQIKQQIVYYTRQKTKKEVSVPLISGALDLLDENMIGTSKPVFHFLPSDTTAKKHLNKWMKRANITKNITWYCARHTFGTLLASSGQGLVAICKLMGNTEKIAMAYINHIDDLKKRAMESLPHF